MAAKKRETDDAKTFCLFGKLSQGLEDFSKKAPEFRKHLDRSHLELLKAIKTLVDSKIKNLEKQNTPGKRKVARKITIE